MHAEVTEAVNRHGGEPHHRPDRKPTGRKPRRSPRRAQTESPDKDDRQQRRNKLSEAPLNQDLKVIVMGMIDESCQHLNCRRPDAVIR